MAHEVAGMEDVEDMAVAADIEGGGESGCLESHNEQATLPAL
jgi:hypothetical protein